MLYKHLSYCNVWGLTTRNQVCTQTVQYNVSSGVFRLWLTEF